MQTVFNQSIWGDEGFSAILSMKSLPEIIRIIINDTSPPLWNISEWVVFNTFGTSEIAIRGLATFYFLLAVLFVYKIGNFIWDKKTGLIAAILTFLNPFFFTYAFEGRMYSILAFGVTMSMYFFLKILYDSDKNSKLNIVGYIIGTLWAMYSHHFAIFALFVQGFWFIYEFFFGKRKTAINIFKGFILVGIGYIPWLYPLYKQTTMVGGGFWLGTPTLEDLIKIMGEYLAVGIKHKFAFLSLYLALILLALRNWKEKIRNSLIFTMWFLGPIVMTWLVSQVFQSIFFNRYLLYSIPGAMLILASQRRKYVNILFVVLIGLFVIIDYHYFTHPIKLPFREMSQYVKSAKNENDFLVNWNSASHHIWETKYYGIPAPIYIPGEGELPFFVGTALMGEGDIIHELPDGIKRVGVITTGSIEEIELPGYTESEVKQMDRLKFIWYEKM
ncbi:MAG: glycosyltransferase family 39 protein [Candidatus Sifarchaeia archaeon]|jgi:uncharacterized membrane protein